MDAREERGLIIAATCRLNRMSDGTYLVPSQTKAGEVAAYRVNLEAKTCTCLDHTDGGFTCKHYYAASIVHKRDVLPDGTVIETKQMTFPEKKVYKQDWPKYNRAQATEKRRFRVLLHDLCRGLPARVRAGDWLGGRHPGVAVWLPVENPTGHPGAGGRCLDVMIDNDRRDEQLRHLRVMIRLAACCG